MPWVYEVIISTTCRNVLKTYGVYVNFSREGFDYFVPISQIAAAILMTSPCSSQHPTILLICSSWFPYELILTMCLLYCNNKIILCVLIIFQSIRSCSIDILKMWRRVVKTKVNTFSNARFNSHNYRKECWPFILMAVLDIRLSEIKSTKTKRNAWGPL